MAKRRFAGERIADLQEALLPMKDQPGNRNSPYFIGMNESTWSSMVDRLHEDIQLGYRNKQDVANILKVSPEEAERFFDWSNKRKFKYGRTNGFVHNQNRHKHYGVPHAYSAENVYNELLKANGFNSRLNNEVDDMATDLIATIDGHDRFVDVQNRSPRGDDALSIGVLQQLIGSSNTGIGLRAWKNSDSDVTLGAMFEKIRKNMIGELKAQNLDKLSQSVELAPEGYGKEFIIGGRYQPGDVENVMNKPEKGSYDFVKPRDIDLIDLNRVRNEMMSMSKGDLIAHKVRPVQDTSKLKLTVPMEFIKELGALNNNTIDPELIKLVRR